MSSINPVVGVTVCIGALGAGLAYLAFNNNDEEEEVVVENETTQKDVGKELKELKKVEQEGGSVEPEKKVEKKVEVSEEEKQKVKEEVAEEVTEEANKKSNMSNFLKETYDNMQADILYNS